MIFIALRAPFFLSSKLFFEKNATERPDFVRAQAYRTKVWEPNDFSSVLNLKQVSSNVQVFSYSCNVYGCRSN